ncbi:MAG: hypothetical protein GY803_10855, partial [Chloroflexi bacterium]|nr:hypothetical protein [Chloroflexota bacterium]
MQINGGYSEQSFPLENQFVGRFQGVPGIVQTEDGEIELKMRGEVALYGENSGDDFGIERLRRVLVLGVPIAPIENDPFGILSLGGPLPDSPLKYDGDFVDGLHMKLHYRRLSREDPRRPRREIIGGRLSWQSINPIDYDTIQLEGVAFTTYMLEDKSLEYVFEVKFAKPVNIILRRIQPKNEAALLFSLVDHCPPPDTPCPPPGPTTTTTTGAVRNVPIKFINLSNVADVSTLCEEQVEEICAIWRKKAALDVTLSPNQEGASSVNWAVVNASVAEKADFINFDEDDDRARLAGDIPGIPRLLGSDDHIEVYIVETLSAPGGVSNGVTYYGGTWLAMCVLARPEMAA